MKILWDQVIRGDRSAYSQAYLFLFQRFYNYGLKLTPDVDLVEDAIQEVLLALWLDRQKLGAVKNPDAYCFVSFRNNLIQKIKTRANQLPLGEDGWEPEFSAAAIWINEELTEDLRQKLQLALNALTSRQREAIFLRFYEGLSYEDVANALSITVKATYKIVARALLQLRAEMPLPITAILCLLRGIGKL